MENHVHGQTIEPFFPEDFLFKEILPKVDTKSVNEFKSVSKNWLARISSGSTFIADHTAHHRSTTPTPTELCKIIGVEVFGDCDPVCKLLFTGHDSKKLVEIDTAYIRDVLGKPVSSLLLLGCGSGLICLKLCYLDQTYDLVVWNPVTREFKCLPLPEAGSLHDDVNAAYYFGIEKGGDDYKLVCFDQVWSDDDNSIEDVHVQVYSKSTGGWRKLNGFSEFEVVVSLGLVVTVDGTISWLINYKDRTHRRNFFNLLSFDLRAEKFQELKGPTSKEYYKFIKLIKWEGCLCVVLMGLNQTRCRYYIKTTNGDDNNNDHYCWKLKIVSFPPVGIHQRTSGFLGNQLILGSFRNPQRFLCDPTSRKVTAGLEGDIGDSVSFYAVSDHIHTLVSPF